ncbi:hypothetical protein SNE40_002922 [Patella caerulea]|uniref:Uncharacterized protein n=1 Tax=Patella caerulea TaxID=87958 RepID=A0AAN8KEY1_PATCE
MNNLQTVHIDPERALEKTENLTQGEQTSFRKLIGQLNWAVQGSRPDMAFELISLSTKLQCATVSDLIRAIKQINRLKDIDSVLNFPKLQCDKSELKLVLYTDASLGNLNNGLGSTAAHILWLVDSNHNSCPISWHSAKIKRVVRSTLAAEMLSLQEGLESCVYYRSILTNLLGIDPSDIDIIAYVDNKSVIEGIASTKLVDDKRLRIDIAAIQESVQKHEVKHIKWIKGDDQLANCMTKRGANGFTLLKVLHQGLIYFP